MMRSSVLKTALFAGVAILGLPSAGLAQTTTPPPTDKPSSGLGEVVVTARRTTENLQRTPVAVSAFSQAQLDAQGAQDTTDLQGAVPNLNIAHGRGAGDATNIYIRGVGQPDALQTFDPAVGVYVDDVYYSRIQGTLFELLNLADVEVLRGPQGTLYGKNTIGGALKLTTLKPNQSFRALADITFGDYNTVDVKGAVSGPIADTLAIGLSALSASHDGYVKDPLISGRRYNDQDTKAVRAQLAWTPSSVFRLDLSADYTKENPHLTLGQATSTLSTAFGGVLAAVSNPPPAWHFLASASPGLPDKQPLESSGFEAEASWKITPDWTLKSISAYRKLKLDLFEDIDATPVQLGDVEVAFNQDQISQELQLDYSHGPWTIVSGLYYLREHVPSHQNAFANDFLKPFTFLRTIDDDLRTTSEAAYTNATYALTDRLRVSAGLRYTSEAKNYYRTTSTFSTLAAVVSTFTPPFPKTTWTNVSPMASIDYQLTPQALIYGRVAEGFQSGGFNGRANSANQNLPYAPEKLTSYEIGAKTDWYDHRLRLNGDVFYNDYKDFQASVGASETLNGIPTPILTVLNAGKLNIYGAELELTAAPIAGLKLDSEIGLLHAAYGQFNDTAFPGGSRKSETPAFSPKITARFGAGYEWSVPYGYLTLSGQARYRSQMALSVDNVVPATGARYPGLWQGAYWVEDIQLVWENSDRRYSLGVYGKNIGNEVYKNDAQNFITVGGILTAYYGDPATWNVTFRYRY